MQSQMNGLTPSEVVKPEVLSPMAMDGANAQVQQGRESELVAAQGRAEIEAAYVMAMQRPRNVDYARAKVLEACKRPTFAKAAVYRKPIGGGFVEGLSVRAAEEVLRCWKNVRIVPVELLDTREIRKIRVTCTDLENNVSFAVEFTMNKTVERKDPSRYEVLGQRQNSKKETVYICAATEDDLLVKQAAQVSKAIRTCGLRLIPADIQEDMMNACRETRNKQDAVDPLKARKEVIDAFFFGLKVMPADLVEYIGHPVEQCSAAEISELRELYRAIEDGDANWADALRARKEARAASEEERRQTAPRPIVQKPSENEPQAQTTGDDALANGGSAAEPESGENKPLTRRTRQTRLTV